MNFWEDVAEKTKAGAQKIQQITLETVDKVKLKTKIAKLKNDATKLYTEIGKLVYSEICGESVEDYNDKIEEKVGEITEIKNEIAECERELTNE